MILCLVLCFSDWLQSSSAAMAFGGEKGFSAENFGFRLSSTAHYLANWNLPSPPQSSHLHNSWWGKVICRECFWKYHIAFKASKSMWSFDNRISLSPLWVTCRREMARSQTSHTSKPFLLQKEGTEIHFTVETAHGSQITAPLMQWSKCIRNVGHRPFSLLYM